MSEDLVPAPVVIEEPSGQANLPPAPVPIPLPPEPIHAPIPGPGPAPAEPGVVGMDEGAPPPVEAPPPLSERLGSSEPPWSMPAPSPDRRYLPRAFQFTHEGVLLAGTFYQEPAGGITADGWYLKGDNTTQVYYDSLAQLIQDNGWAAQAQPLLARLINLVNSPIR